MREEDRVSSRTLFVYPLLLATGIGIGLAGSGVGCNSYDLLIHDRFLQASFSNRVDIMWVVDSSNSMHDNQENLKHSFACFINELATGGVREVCDTDADCESGVCGTCGVCELADEGDLDLTLESLSDALDVYEQFLHNRTQFLNYQMGVTTTQPVPCANLTTGQQNCLDSMGNTGRLRSLGNSGNETDHPPTFLKPDTESLIPDFQALVDVGIEGGTEEHGMWVVAEAICASLEMPCESDLNELTCDDLGDNDMDGETDCEDEDCYSDPYCGGEDCEDTVDNDGDGDVDCDDADCEHELACGGAGDGVELIYDCHPHGHGIENWNDADPLYEFCSCLPQRLHDYNIDETGVRFMRDNSTLVVILVSDEGDYTTNMGAAEWPWDISDCEIDAPWPLEVQEACAGNPQVLCENFCKLDVYLDFFEALDRRVVFAIIGPGAELKVDQQGNITTEAPCNDQNSSVQMMEFYLWAAELTGGLYAPIDVLVDGSEHECTDADFNQTLSDLGQLVMNLSRTWHLNRVPDLDTVMVYVDNDEVPPAECLPNDEDCVPSSHNVSCTGEPSAGLNGWTYDESTQSIRFHGDCIPDFNEIVDVYYLPEFGAGRPLPF